MGLKDKDMSSKTLLGVYGAILTVLISNYDLLGGKGFTTIAVLCAVPIIAAYLNIRVPKMGKLMSSLWEVIQSGRKPEEKLVEIERIVKLSVLAWDELFNANEQIEVNKNE